MIKPMLAVSGELPAGGGWAYEFKWDGVRCIADSGRLFSRAGVELTAAFPELAVPGDVVLDGELVVMGDDGRPSFALLADRLHVRDPAKAARLAAVSPVTYLVFDLPGMAGKDLAALPYRLRRRVLQELDVAGPHLAVSPSFDDGPATVAAATASALEGVVAKRLDSPYRPGVRSPDWVKVKPVVTGDFVVGGWRPGARQFGALLLGVPGPDGLRYVGRVGVGISVQAELELLAALAPLRTGVSPFEEVPRADARGATWVNPSVVVEVGYDRLMPDGRLRFARLLRMRPDKTPMQGADLMGDTDDYHPEHGGDCPGTCDWCGWWLCRHADDVALCDYPDGHQGPH